MLSRGKYGHHEASCPVRKTSENLDKGAALNKQGEAGRPLSVEEVDERGRSVFLPWTAA